jgi:hypothetical protein
VTVPTCATGCGRPSSQAFLCRGCSRRLEKILAELPSQLADLTVTITRQARAGRGDGGNRAKAVSQPLPIDLRAAHLADLARNALSTWVRHVTESRGLDHPRLLTSAAMAVWLTANIASICQDELAGEMYTAMTALKRALDQAVDNHGKRYAGPCTAKLTVDTWDDDGTVRFALLTDRRECGLDLRTRPGAKVIRCDARDETGRVIGCGAEYEAVEQMRRVLEWSRERLDTAAFIGNALEDAGYMKAATVRKWVQRGKVYAWREDEIGRALYRVGDFLELLQVGDNAKVTA